MHMNNKYMRPLKAKNLDSLYSKYIDRTGKLGCRKLSNISITPVGHTGEGFIEEKENWILDDCNMVAEIKTAETGQEIRDQRVLYCGFMRCEWGHFLVNSMSRLWYIIKNPDEYFDKFVFCLPSSIQFTLTGNFKELLTILGIIDKVEFINEATAFREVLVPDLSWSLQKHYSEEFNLVYDTVCSRILVADNRTDSNRPKRVFFTRSGLSKARLSEIGIEMLDDFFRRNGFEIIYPERLSLSDMVYILHYADLVAGASGTTVHNILFGRKGQKLVIAERNVINNDFQPGINLARKLDVTYIDSFLTVNSVNSGLGPFFYYYSTGMADFAGDNGYVGPSEIFTNETYLRKSLRKYFKTWHKFYCRQWYFQKCAIPEIDAFYEAYSDSCTIVGQYLTNGSPLYLSDHLSVSRFIKANFSQSGPIYKFLKACYSFVKY